jgi:hypothetical protein
MDVVIAVFVLLGMATVSAWSWRAAPLRAMADQFKGIWGVTPWGKQLMLDFFGLEAILALWMIADAEARGSWLVAIACVVTMPLFGAMSAALYWLIR